MLEGNALRPMSHEGDIVLSEIQAVAVLTSLKKRNGINPGRERGDVVEEGIAVALRPDR